MDNVKIIDNGVESEVAGIAYLKINGKNLLFYSLNDFSDEGLPKIRIAATRNDNNTISDEEWKAIQDAIRNIIVNVENPNIEFMKIDADPYDLGQIKKLAVKPEQKTAFTDNVAAHLIEKVDVQVAGDENPVMPFFDETIDTNNTADQLQDQTVVENPFDKSIQPDVIEATPVEEIAPTNVDAVETQIIEQPVLPTETPADASLVTETAPAAPIIEPVVPVIEPVIEPVAPIVEQTEAPVVEQPVETVNAFTDVAPVFEETQVIEPVAEVTPVDNTNQVREELDGILKKVAEIETIAQNIKIAVSNLEALINKKDTPVQSVEAETPIVEESPVAAAIMEPLVEPVIEQVQVAPVVEPVIEQAPVAPVVEPVVAPVVEQAPVVETDPVVETVPNVEVQTETIPFVPNVESIPDGLVDAPAVVPEIEPASLETPIEPIADAAFAGMSPTTMQKVA